MAKCLQCGASYLGISNSKVAGLCSSCSANQYKRPLYFCNFCKTPQSSAKLRGHSAIELILYLFYIVPGLIYSIWRRSNPPSTCPSCNRNSIVPLRQVHIDDNSPAREEKDCPHCAEKILSKAVICKHCGNNV